MMISALSACSGGGREAAFPKEVPGGWKLFGSEEFQIDQAQADVQNRGLKRWLKARYEGPGYPDVLLYQMSTQASAFELVQKWRGEPGAIVSHVDNVFIVYRSDYLKPEELNKFATAWEGAFKAL